MRRTQTFKEIHLRKIMAKIKMHKEKKMRRKKGMKEERFEFEVVL